MRLVLSLIAHGNFSRQEFERKYRSAMHGIIHSALSSSVFPVVQKIHESGDPGMFSFSSLSGKFSKDGEILENNIYKLSISSPSGPIFFTLATLFKRIHLSKKMLELGECRFSITTISEFKPVLSKGDIIMSDGPIVLTKSTNERKQFVLMKGGEKNRNNLIDSELFFSLFKANLKHKAEQLKLPLAERIDDISNPISMEIKKHGKTLSAFTVRMQIKPGTDDYFVVGNRISMAVQFSDAQDLTDFEKLMDCGFGVMNGYGFGFMKKVLKND